MGPRSSFLASCVFLWRLAFALVVTSVTAAVGLAGGSLVLEHKLTQAKQVAVRLHAAPGTEQHTTPHRLLSPSRS